MAETFNCPTCGAPLETDGRETTIHCEYCGESVIVPQELRKNDQPVAEPGPTFPMGPDGSAQSAGRPGRMDPSQVRQMMAAVRSGQLDEAAQFFQTATGLNQVTARQTIDLITQQLSGSNRILPTQLAALMMGAFSQPVMGSTYAYSPVPAVRPRRRRTNLGCLVALAIVVLALYLSYTALSPTQLLSAFTSGNGNSSVRQTALAPADKIATVIAPIVGKLSSSNSNPPSK